MTHSLATQSSNHVLHTYLEQMVTSEPLHALWLNTLSFLENVGARKIAQAEHPTRVSLSMLKHAAEEARHAYYLKKQLSKIHPNPTWQYRPHEILGGYKTFHYLHQLDVQICRFLKEQGITDVSELKWAAYLLVTYAIEVRAKDLYSVYQTLLTQHQSPVRVKSILSEEEQHLAEMQTQLQETFGAYAELYEHKVCALEKALFESWLQSMMKVTGIQGGSEGWRQHLQ